MSTRVKSWVGRRLAGSRYAVTGQLGEGGMGCVFRAHDANLDCDVVVKVPRPALLDDPEFAGRFAREVRSLVRLVHPHIVRITDVGEEEGIPFAVMQYLPGGSLHDRQRGPGDRLVTLPPEALAGWLEPVAEALDYIHAQGYVHRDVKPANILFDAHGNAYVGDFGVAKAVAAGATGRQAATMTETGMVLGTRHYMAPEMLLGEDYSGRIDQYALAVTVYEILSGRMPFDGPTPAAILLKQTSEEAPPLHRLAPSVPRELSSAVARALARDPGQRFAGCLEFARAVLHGLPAAEPMARRGGLEAGADDQRITCPKCGTTYAVPARALQKKRLRCKACGAVFPPAGPPPAAERRAPSPATAPEIQGRIETEGLPVHRGLRRTDPAPPPGEETRPGTPATAPSGGGGRAWTWTWGGLAAVLAMVLIGVVLWVRSSPAPRSEAPSGPPEKAATAREIAAAAPTSGEARLAPTETAKPTGTERAPSPAAEAHAAPAPEPPPERSLVAQGNQFCRQHEYAQAIAQYTEALRLNARSAAAHAGLAEALLASHDYEQALQEANEAIRLDATLAAAHVPRGRIHEYRNNHAGALSEFDEAIRLDPKLTPAYAYRALTRATLGKHEEALADCAEAIRLEPTLAAAYTARGFAHQRHGEYDQAIADATEALRLDPRSAWSYRIRGLIYVNKKDYDRAIADCTEALRLDPAYAQAYNTRGFTYLEKKDFDLAIADCSEAIRLDPRLAVAYGNRARACNWKKDYDQAISDATEALHLEPNLALGYFQRGYAYNEKHLYDQALADCSEAIRLVPGDASAYNNRGNAHLGRKDYARAIADYTEAIRLNPKFVLAYNNRALAYDRKGDRLHAEMDRAEARRLSGR
jgi:tetratricopeptide (TPR) repeat protein